MKRIWLMLLLSCLLAISIPSPACGVQQQPEQLQVTMLLNDLIPYSTEEQFCYEHDSQLPCKYCACLESMTASQAIQCVRAGDDGYYLLCNLREGKAEPQQIDYSLPQLPIPAEEDSVVSNLLVMKTDFAGNLIWSTIVRGLAGSISYPGDMAITSDQRCVIAQKRWAPGSGAYVEIDCLNNNGSIIWQRTDSGTTTPSFIPALPISNDLWLSVDSGDCCRVEWGDVSLYSMAADWKYTVIDPYGACIESGDAQDYHDRSVHEPELTANSSTNSVTAEASATEIRMTFSASTPNDIFFAPVENSDTENVIPVLVDGIPVIFPDVQPFASAENRILVPLRPALEAMGVTVTWNGENNQALLNDGATNVIFTLNSPTYIVDQIPLQMDTVPVVSGDRIMLPIRFAAEAFGAAVTWQNDSVVIQTR